MYVIYNVINSASYLNLQVFKGLFWHTSLCSKLLMYYKHFVLNIVQEVVINIENFLTESCCDSLRIYDSPDESVLLAELRGSHSNLQYQSTQRFMYLRFSSDASVNERGFILNYNCEFFKIIQKYCLQVQSRI